MGLPGVQPLGYDISGITFASLAQTWLLQRQYHWQLFMPSQINGVFGPLISSFCQEIKFGDYSMGNLSKMKQGAFQRFYAGVQEIDTVQMSFITSIDNAVNDYFYGWYHLNIDEDGYYHPKDHYKKTIYVALYDRTGVESVRFVLKGCFPKNKPQLPLTYSGDDMLRLNLVLSVDTIEMSSLIGSVRSAVTNAIGGVANKVFSMFG